MASTKSAIGQRGAKACHCHLWDVSACGQAGPNLGSNLVQAFACVSSILDSFHPKHACVEKAGGRPCPWARRKGPSPDVPCYQWFPRLASLGKAGWTCSKISITCIIVLTLPESQAHNENNSNSHNLKPFSEHKAALSHSQTAFLKPS